MAIFGVVVGYVITVSLILLMMNYAREGRDERAMREYWRQRDGFEDLFE